MASRGWMSIGVLAMALMASAVTAQVIPISGLWADPSLEGEGYNVIQSDAGTTVFYFGNDATGNRLWLVSDTISDPIEVNQVVELTMFTGGAGMFDSPAPPSEIVTWGLLRLLVTNCTEANFELEGDDGFKASAGAKLANITGVDQSVCDTIVTEPEPSEPFVLSSMSFGQGGRIPTRHTCQGDDVSPQISWVGAPSGTARFAVIMDDENPPCGGGDQACRHWQVYNIPPNVTGFAEGEDVTAIEGVIVGAAYNFRNVYAGPCPPNQHTYNFTLYALRSSMPTLGGTQGLTRSRFVSTYGEHIIDSANLNAFFP